MAWVRIPATEVRVGDTIKFFDVKEGRKVLDVHSAKKGVTILAENKKDDSFEPRIFCSPTFMVLLWILPGTKRIPEKEKRRYFFTGKKPVGLR